MAGGKIADSEPSSDGRLAVAKNIVSKAESRRQVDGRRRGEALRNSGLTDHDHSIRGIPHTGHKRANVNGGKLRPGDRIHRDALARGVQAGSIEHGRFSRVPRAGLKPAMMSLRWCHGMRVVNRTPYSSVSLPVDLP